MPTILCFGDSNTHGTTPLTELGRFARYPKGQRWPDVLAEALGPEVEVIAEGLPGRTTVHDDPVEGGKRSGLDVLPAILLSHVPLDLMILMLGTNDLKARFSVTDFEIARSIERLVLDARSLVPDLEILIIAPAPVREAGALKDVFQDAEKKQENLDAHLRATAERQGCAFLAAADHVSVSAVDGVHWEVEDHQRFGHVVARKVMSSYQLVGDRS